MKGDIKMQHGVSRINGKVRKMELHNLISCLKCPYHRRDNVYGRIPRTDSYKNIERKTIRKMTFLEGGE